MSFGRVVSVGLTTLLVLALASGAAGMLLDNTFEVRVSVVVEAPVAAIDPFVASPRQHVAWLGWNDDVDPTLRHTYEGPEAGRGARVHWTGEGFGRGSLLITDSTAAGVEWEQHLPAGVESQGQVRYEVLTPERTRVTWTERGTIPRPHGPYFVDTLERVMVPQSERALAFLAAAAEGRPPPARETETSAPAP